jgi:predicted TIM-barrel fold metal-dependent hydrolase
MSDVIDRPTLEQEATANSRLRIIDCDVHPSLHARSDLNPFLSRRWQEHLKTYGDHLRTPYIGTTPYPRSSPLIARRDAWPPTGGPPGSDLDFMRKQHLDPLDVEFGILQVLDLFIFSQQNLEFGAAIQRAINEWQLAHWVSREPRLKASILVGQDDTEAAVAEIERCARISRARRNWTCRSGFTPAAMAVTRQPAAAGRPFTSRSTIPTRIRWRRSSPVW